jgi:hypothetical protein
MSWFQSLGFHIQVVPRYSWAFVTADSIAGRWAVLNKGQDIEVGGFRV